MQLDKRGWRKYIQEKKKVLSIEQRSKQSTNILSTLELHPLFQSATIVLLYHSLPDEVQTAEFIRKWSHQKQIVLPVVCGDDLELHLYQGESSLKTGRFYIKEPTTPLFQEWNKITLAIIPGVAFDADKNRLARGKGYYDRLLRKMPNNLYKIGICFDYQYIKQLPVEDFDIPMDEVLTYTERTD